MSSAGSNTQFVGEVDGGRVVDEQDYRMFGRDLELGQELGDEDRAFSCTARCTNLGFGGAVADDTDELGAPVYRSASHEEDKPSDGAQLPRCVSPSVETVHFVERSALMRRIARWDGRRGGVLDSGGVPVSIGEHNHVVNHLVGKRRRVVHELTEVGGNEREVRKGPVRYVHHGGKLRQVRERLFIC